VILVRVHFALGVFKVERDKIILEDDTAAVIAEDQAFHRHRSPPLRDKSVRWVQIPAVDLLGYLFSGKIAEEDVPGGVLLGRNMRDVLGCGSAAQRPGFAVMPGELAHDPS
jgi:hypothetical protein